MSKVHLNSQQQQVANSRGRRVIVKAGAGTGKTAASIGWVSSLLEEGVPAWQILMLTFTRKAAQEMVRRSQLAAGELAHKLTAGTYHGVAVQHIRQDPIEFGYVTEKISLLDQNDSNSLWKTAARTLEIKDPFPSIKATAGSVSSLRNRDMDVAGGLIKLYGEKSDAVSLAVTYEALKKRGNLLDYDDLLVRWRDRLRDDADYASRLRGQYKYVLVDEMQDNNILQYQILEHLNPDHLLVVGDVNQSIYGFRAAMPALMTRFEQENDGVQAIKLEVNYRSGQNILDLANEVIKDSDAPLELKSATDKSSTVVARRLPGPEVEAYQTFMDIKCLISRGTKPNTIAVLSRGSRTLMSLELELRRGKIEYKKYGGQTIAEASEVKDFTSFVRIMHNPKDRPALMRALTQFPGVGDIAATRAAESDDFFGAFPKKAAEAKHWVEVMESMPFGKSLEYLLAKIKPLIKHNYDESADSRFDNLENLVNDCVASEFTRTDFIDAFVTEKFEG